jgi:hypothetical protein
MPNEPGIRVTLSPAGRALAYPDNALLRAAKREAWAWVRVIVGTVALGLLLGYTAAQTAGVVS